MCKDIFWQNYVKIRETSEWQPIGRAIAKKLLGVVIIASRVLVVTAYGEADSVVNFGNGITGSSRPDGVGAGKAGGAVNATPLGLHGTSVTGTGTTQEITVDIQGAKVANETVSVEGTAVTVEKGPVTLTITTTTDPKVQNDSITADIKSIFMNYAPVTGQFADTGTVSASFNARSYASSPTECNDCRKPCRKTRTSCTRGV